MLEAKMDRVTAMEKEYENMKAKQAVLLELLVSLFLLIHSRHKQMLTYFVIITFTLLLLIGGERRNDRRDGGR
jgi:hypothetical protein